MAKLSMRPGSTSQTVYIFVQDSSVTTGAGLTGLAFNTGSLTAYYVRPLGSATAITLATQTVTGAWSSGGFVEVSSANMPGLYRLDIPDAALATGVRSVAILLKGAANMSPCVLEIDLNAEANTVAISGTDLTTGVGAIAGTGIVDRGTAQSATSTTLVLRSAAAFADDELIGATIVIRSASTGAGQARVITDYVGSTDTATVDTWTVTPTGTIVYEIYAGSPSSASLLPNVNVTQISGDSTAADNLEAVLDGTGANLSLAALTVSAGITITQSTTNGNGLTCTGNGTGHGAAFVSGSGATGQGMRITAASTNGSALLLAASGSGSGLNTTGGATGHGIAAVGGATSGDGINSIATTSGHGITATGVGSTRHGINATGGSTSSAGISATGGGTGAGLLTTGGATGVGHRIVGGGTSGAGVSISTTSGDGILVAPTVGHGLSLTGNGTSKHGILSTGSAGGTGDGISAVAGAGGVDIRGNVTGNITGNLSGTVASVVGNVGGNVAGSAGSVIGAVGSVAGNVAGNVLGSVASVTTVNDKTGYSLSAGGVDAIWDEPKAGHVTAGTYGLYLDAAVSGVSTGGLSLQDITDAVWDEPNAAHTDIGSMAALLANTSTDSDAIRSKTDNLTFSVAGKLDANTTNVNGYAIVGTTPPFS
jgi:hypothetical protein